MKLTVHYTIAVITQHQKQMLAPSSHLHAPLIHYFTYLLNKVDKILLSLRHPP